MEWHRVKNIIIVILLIINGFLLVLVASRRNEAFRYEQSALERSVQVLAQNGIELSIDTVVTSVESVKGAVERSTELERTAAAALLGAEADMSDLGGGLYSYSAPAGTVSFRTGGEFALRPEEHAMWDTENPQEHSAALMDALELEYRLQDCDLSEGSGTVSYLQLLEDMPVFSCRVVFRYENGRLTDMSGTFLLVETPALEECRVLNLPTVLMKFLDEVLTGGDVCSKILSVEPGFLPSQSFSSTVRLQPVWFISTNTVDYYVDGVTGELTRAVQTMSTAAE